MREHYYAISGKIGAGKTSIADGLVFLFGFRRRGFADSIKEAAALALDCPVEDVYREKRLFRSSLQALGQAGREYWGDSYWVARFLRWVEDVEAGTPNDERDQVRIVLDDLRFPNEAEALKDFGFRLVRIEDEPRAHKKYCRKQGYTGEQQAHISETALDSWTEWDIVLDGRPRSIQDVFASFLIVEGLAESVNWARCYAARALGHED